MQYHTRSLLRYSRSLRRVLKNVVSMTLILKTELAIQNTEKSYTILSNYAVINAIDLIKETQMSTEYGNCDAIYPITRKMSAYNGFVYGLDLSDNECFLSYECFMV
jgi:hypothetical protein